MKFFKYIYTIIHKQTLWAFLFSLLWSSAQAIEIEHQLIKRIVVFPLHVPSSLAPIAEKAWWDIREELTQNDLFLVASKQFLSKNEVYQARGQLEPSDCILLGKLLDAHALITTELKDRKLVMTAYDAGFGLMLWQRDFQMHYARPVAEQIVEASKKLIRDFLASIPYQGYQIIDPLRGKTTFEDADEIRTEVQIPSNSGIQVGDPVQWIHLRHKTTEALFQGGGEIRAFAEGKVVMIEKSVASIQVLRATQLNEIKEYSLVKFPKEFERVRFEKSLKINLPGKSSTSLPTVQAEILENQIKEKRPLLNTLSFIGSVLGALLLAF